MKPALVFLPGLLCDAALFKPQTDGLADVCVPWAADLTRDTSIEAMAARVLREVSAKEFSLAGLSMGGYVAQEMMRQAPDRVQRLALLDTRSRPDEPHETERRRLLMTFAQTERGFTPVTTRLLPLLIHAGRIKEDSLVAVIRAMAEGMGVEAFLRQQQAIMARPDFRPGLGAVQCPTLVICGREDALTPVEFHEEIAALIPGARLEIIEDCGHLCTLERPQEVNALLREWLSTPLP
ncbi:MAG: alpha/beta fold hydrolase [Betaproteobacteria bacterium]|nr:alpha/beta fold hydrolase [Betaproteobacteria bacterium]